MTGTGDSLDEYHIEMQCHYRDLKGPPSITYEPDKVHINLKVSFMLIFIHEQLMNNICYLFQSTKAFGTNKKDQSHESTFPCQNTGEARLYHFLLMIDLFYSFFLSLF